MNMEQTVASFKSNERPLNAVRTLGGEKHKIIEINLMSFARKSFCNERGLPSTVMHYNCYFFSIACHVLIHVESEFLLIAN